MSARQCIALLGARGNMPVKTGVLSHCRCLDLGELREHVGSVSFSRRNVVLRLDGTVVCSVNNGVDIFVIFWN